MSCRVCGADLQHGARFCQSCGNPVAAACSACGAELPDGARFCPACGTVVDAAVPSIEPTAEGDRERKVATILFADLVGYTGLNEQHDPELVQSMVATAFERLSREVERYEGTIEKFAGDAVLAIFGVPHAHEDDPERAVRAALEMQAAMAELATISGRAGRPELSLRVGVDTGNVLVDLGRIAAERDRLVTGDPVNTAARLQAAAAVGAVVVGPGAYAATRDVVEYEEIEPLLLKGKALPVPAWRAVRVKARRGGLRAPLGLEAPLIGRDEELGLLKEAVRRMANERRPHMVTIFGAAGVGKSRLIWELEKYLDGLPETYHWRKGRCFSYGQASFGGLIEIVRSDARIQDDQNEAATQRLLDERLGELGLSGDGEIQRALGVLLGDTATSPPNRDAMFEALRRYLEAISRRGPLVLVIEDIHWADEGLLELLDFVARWAEAPILLLCLARHELLERRPGWGGGIANSATIMLEPLAPAENEALLDALLPGSLPAGFKQRVIAVAEGNPLFCEEIVRMLIDRGMARRADDGWHLVGPIEELKIPDSIQALLAARLDSLPGPEKRLTQAAAVVGRVFWDAVLAHVLAGASPDLDRLLRGLRAKELVVSREPSSLAESREYGFRHVLIRDVAYESVPKADRAEQHLRVARWAEERLAAREDELVELLASHYRSALGYREEVGAGDGPELDDLRRRMFDYAMRAGSRSAELWQAGAAAGWFRVALEQAEKVKLPVIEHGRAALEFLQVGVQSERTEDSLAVARRSMELLRGAAAVDQDASNLLGRLEAQTVSVLFSAGNPEEARELLASALQRFEDGPPSEVRAELRWRLGWLNWRAFSPAEAVPILEQAVAEARTVGAAAIERGAMHDLAIAYEYVGNTDRSLALLRESLDLARQAGDRMLLFRGYINLPALMVSSTWQMAEAAALAYEGLERARRGGQRFFNAFIAGNLALHESESANFDAARQLADEALQLAADLGDESLIGLAHGISGQAWARQGRLGDAVTAWHEAALHGADEPQSRGAMAIARALEAWPTDPRAAVSGMAADLDGATNAMVEGRELARMAMRTGQQAEAAEAISRLMLGDTEERMRTERRWRDALLGEPSTEGVSAIVEAADRYRGVGFLVTAAEGYADAALVAARARLASAEELAQRSSALYERISARPILADPLEETQLAMAAAAVAG